MYVYIYREKCVGDDNGPAVASAMVCRHFGWALSLTCLWHSHVTITAQSLMAMDEVQTRVFGIYPLFYFIFFLFLSRKKKKNGEDETKLVRWGEGWKSKTYVKLDLSFKSALDFLDFCSPNCQTHWKTLSLLYRYRISGSVFASKHVPFCLTIFFPFWRTRKNDRKPFLNSGMSCVHCSKLFACQWDERTMKSSTNSYTRVMQKKKGFKKIQ